MTTQPPSGTVTFILTDLEGSTRMWEQGPQGAQGAVDRRIRRGRQGVSAGR